MSYECVLTRNHSTALKDLSSTADQEPAVALPTSGQRSPASTLVRKRHRSAQPQKLLRTGPGLQERLLQSFIFTSCVPTRLTKLKRRVSSIASAQRAGLWFSAAAAEKGCGVGVNAAVHIEVAELAESLVAFVALMRLFHQRGYASIGQVYLIWQRQGRTQDKRIFSGPLESWHVRSDGI